MLVSREARTPFHFRFLPGAARPDKVVRAEPWHKEEAGRTPLSGVVMPRRIETQQQEEPTPPVAMPQAGVAATPGIRRPRRRPSSRVLP